MKDKLKPLLFVLCALCFVPLWGQELRWDMTPEGIEWGVGTDEAPHTDHLEMAGQKLAAIITYGTGTNGELVLSRRLIFPMLRTIPNNTSASLNQIFEQADVPQVLVGGLPVTEYPDHFTIDGTVGIGSRTDGNVRIERTIYPSALKAAYFEKCQLVNTGDRAVTVEISDAVTRRETDPEKGVYGTYIIETRMDKPGTFTVEPGGSLSYTVIFSGRTTCEQPYHFSPRFELEKRKEFVDKVSSKLVLTTPNDTINSFFRFAKIRASESIFDTKNGLMHAPGGQPYYAAVWANDQAEYANPFFPFLGYAEGNESALNSFRLFARYMNDEYRPIPSSVIAEGDDIWNGRGDRGDQAMIAYGASRFALAFGKKEAAEELWPLIEWCLEYLDRQKTPEGIIKSDSDELEERFPSGDANLSTNSLAYGALVSASHLAASLGKAEQSQKYAEAAAALARDIENYFGANVEGYDTYKYYKENTTLRAWIALPLTMGLFDRRDGTVRAMLSDRLWTRNGILTESGHHTFWDRATLYAFNGAFYAGATDEVMPYWSYYTSQRLLGEHVPYAIEAWPEGNQRHLSAESALYCRAIIEGMLGIRPVGFNSFSIKPNLPKGWDEVRLENIMAFDTQFSLTVTQSKKGQVTVKVGQQGRTDRQYKLNGDSPLVIEL